MMMSTMSGEISDSCKDRLITCIPSTAVVGVGDEDRPKLDESDSELKHLIHVAFLLVGSVQP